MQPFTPEELNRDYILKIAKDNPIVYTFLNYHLRGGLTYEQALIGMVAHLITYNEELVKLNINRIEASIPSSYVFKKT